MANLVADICGTNARFGLWDTNSALQENSARLSGVNYFLTSEFPSLAQAIKEYCQQQALQPQHLSLAVAGPVEKDWVAMSNNSWSFSKAELKDSLGLDSLTVSMILPHRRCCRHPWARTKNSRYAAAPIAGTPIAILGPGTGWECRH